MCSDHINHGSLASSACKSLMPRFIRLIVLKSRKVFLLLLFLKEVFFIIFKDLVYAEIANFPSATETAKPAVRLNAQQ